MATGQYYGRSVGARIRYAGERIMLAELGTVDRDPPEGAIWLLRFTPRHVINDHKLRKELAARLHSLGLARALAEISVPDYQMQIDSAIALRCGPVSPWEGAQ